jgi:hypothetical protein
VARIRTIKPETFTSETISSLTLAARWTFVGLWTHVDDEGRTRDNARIIRGALWPNEDETVSSKHVESHLVELEDAEMICRYEVDGGRYFHVVNFHRHQKISHPTPSKLPPCPHQSHPGPRPVRPNDSGNPPESSGEIPEPSEILEPRARVQDARAQATHLRARTPEVEVEVEVEVDQGDEEPSSSPTAAPPGDQTSPRRLDVDALCARLVELMTANGCKPPAITEQWRTAARLLLDRDGREFDKALALLEWSQAHQFWHTNILSMPTFRKQYERMRLQALAEWERDHRDEHRPSTTTRIVNQSLDTVRQIAERDGVDLGALLPFPDRRELTA